MEIIKIKSFLISDDKKLIIDTSLIETVECIKGDNGILLKAVCEDINNHYIDKYALSYVYIETMKNEEVK